MARLSEQKTYMRSYEIDRYPLAITYITGAESGATTYTTHWVTSCMFYTVSISYIKIARLAKPPDLYWLVLQVLPFLWKRILPVCSFGVIYPMSGVETPDR